MGRDDDAKSVFSSKMKNHKEEKLQVVNRFDHALSLIQESRVKSVRYICDRSEELRETEARRGTISQALLS